MFIDGNGDICRVQADGTGLIVLGHAESRDVAVAPDGAFAAVSSIGELRVMDLATGNTSMRFDPPGGHVRGPADWSSDRSQLIVATSVGVWLLAADGTHAAILSDAVAYAPRWSSDGALIAWGSKDLYVMNRDGSGLRSVLSEYLPLWQPAWSPDNEWLAFVSAAGTGGRTIEIVRLDGTERSVVSDLSSRDLYPWWSPDGDWIAYASDAGGGGVYVSRPDGTDRRRVWTGDAAQVRWLRR